MEKNDSIYLQKITQIKPVILQFLRHASFEMFFLCPSGRAWILSRSTQKYHHEKNIKNVNNIFSSSQEKAKAQKYHHKFNHIISSSKK